MLDTRTAAAPRPRWATFCSSRTTTSCATSWPRRSSPTATTSVQAADGRAALDALAAALVRPAVLDLGARPGAGRHRGLPPPAPRRRRPARDRPDRARRRGRRRAGARGGRRRLRDQARRRRRAAQPRARGAAPHPAARSAPARCCASARSRLDPARARPRPATSRCALTHSEFEVLRALLRRRRAAAVAPRAAARDLRRRRVPRPAGDRRPRPPRAREARGRGRRPGRDRHRARRGLPHARRVSGGPARPLGPALEARRSRWSRRAPRRSSPPIAALVPPLEHRIAADRLDEMRQLAGTARARPAPLPARDLRPRSPRARAARRATSSAAPAAGSRCSAASGAALQDTDPDRPTPRRRTAPSASGREHAAERVRDVVRGGEAIVVGSRAHPRAAPVTLVLRKPLNDSRAAVAVMRGALPLAAVAGLTSRCSSASR